MKPFIAISLLALLFFACKPSGNKPSDAHEITQDMNYTLGSIERLDPALGQVLAAEARMEVLSSGYEWTEGPLWVASEKMLLFSDIPRNSIFKWTEKEGATLFLKPAGFTGVAERKGEPGSNGLLLDPQGNLVLCQHGDRRMARLTGGLSDPKATYETVIDNYQGKRFNSPNDATYSKSGDLYFTDPPYGLEGNMDDPAKELPFQGVYRLKAGSETAELLIDTLSRPNGIALSPKEDRLYVANSDPNNAVWMTYKLQDGRLSEGKEFYNATAQVGEEKGLPDGLKVHSSGAIFATGPGGVWVFGADGTVLGKIKTGQATANCAFDNDEKYLYITADMYLLRIKLAG